MNPIIRELHNRWPEIKNSKKKPHQGDFWKFQWTKHGTCCQPLKNLNTPLKYFNQGLIWSRKYKLHDILSKGGINPDSTYSVTQFWHVLKKALGKNPRINCIREKVCISNIFK